MFVLLEGNLTLGGLVITGEFEFKAAGGEIEVIVDADTELKVGSVTLFEFTVSGRMIANDDGLVGLLALQLKVDSPSAASLGFELDAAFQLEINTTPTAYPSSSSTVTLTVPDHDLMINDEIRVKGAT